MGEDSKDKEPVGGTLLLEMLESVAEGTEPTVAARAMFESIVETGIEVMRRCVELTRELELAKERLQSTERTADTRWEEILSLRAMVESEGAQWLMTQCPRCGHRAPEETAMSGCARCAEKAVGRGLKDPGQAGRFGPPWLYEDIMESIPECQCADCAGRRAAEVIH